MPDKPVYPSHLDPKGWEKVKGPVTKAAIKTDVKGALDALHKHFWQDINWQNLSDASHLNDAQHDHFLDTLGHCAAASTTLSVRATSAIAEIDKIPLSKQLLSSSRAHLASMKQEATQLAADLAHVKSELEAARTKVHNAAARAAASFAGWLKQESKRAVELTEECEQRTEASLKSIATVSPGAASDQSGNEANNRRVAAQRAHAEEIHADMTRRAGACLQALQQIDSHVDQEAKKNLAKSDNEGHAALAKFKSGIAQLAHRVQACQQDLHNHPVRQNQSNAHNVIASEGSSSGTNH
jgi:hypothetical protein